MDFGKVLTAMVTPFDENGKVDFKQVTALIEHLISTGTEGLVVAGTTGESPTLSHDEKLGLFRHAVKAADKRVPVIAGTGSHHTEASIKLTKEAEACGVDAVMLVTPYYNKPSQEGLYRHFKSITQETDLPVMLYNVPGRTAVNLEAETVIRLSMIENIVALKEAGGNLDQAAEIIERTPDDFSVYCGDDSLTLPMLAIGAKGVVSVASHVIGEKMSRMVAMFETGDLAEAARLHRKLLPLMNAMFIAPSPAPVKAALRMKGIDAGRVRLPLTELPAEKEYALQNLMNVTE